ncbi:MAG: hypothetical protein AAFR41_08735 [Pseudomonadota bacterium]
MTRLMIRGLLAVCVGVFLFVGAAQADTRSVYTVTGVPVDETAPSVIEAQRRAFASARLEGARRFINKITLSDDRNAVGGIFIDQATAESLAVAVDVEEETRGGGRYVASMSVVLNPRAVRAYLDERGVPYLDRQAPLAVMVPTGGDDAAMDWQDAWPDRDPGALAHYVKAVGPFYGVFSTWADLQPEVEASDGKRVILADLSGDEGAYRVRLIQESPTGRRALGTTNPVPTMADAVRAATAYLGEIWKREAIIRSDIKSLASASIRYTTIAEWNALRTSLIRSPLVSDFQTIAIAKDGAMVRFAFAGEDVVRLQSELIQRGVILDAAEEGWVLRSSGSTVQ